MSIAPTELPFGIAWVTAYFADVDSLQPANLMRWYAEDASFRFAGHPLVKGKIAIAGSLAAFFETIDAMRHDMTCAWVDQATESAALESEVTFTRKDTVQIIIPAMSALRTRDGLVSDFRFVLDPAPLYGAAK